jgi:REP element-mobilizing transposase RayT
MGNLWIGKLIPEWKNSRVALPERRTPGHHRPAWVSGSDPIFLTICGNLRGVNQFAREPQWTYLINATEHLRQLKLWQPLLLLAMPDHVHMITIMPSASGIGLAVRRFKRAASYGTQIKWQAAAFDHRIRSDDSYREKWQYVLANPKRGGLVTESAEWPYVRVWSINSP